jgi:triacylglycerol lipase
VQRPATLLVPGWSDTSRALGDARSFLLREGWPESHVSCVSFADRFGSNVQHAAELRQAVAGLSALSGEERVAVVAHSMGGLALRMYLRANASHQVHTAVFVGTPHRGTWLAWLAWGAGGREMRPGSRLLAELQDRPPPPDVRAVCIRTPVDTRVLPGSSAFLEGADCRMIRAPGHTRMLRHRKTLELIRDVLLQGH